MRNKNKAFLSCAILAGVLLAAMGALAADPSPVCDTTNGYHLVAMANGPELVTCGTDTCTQIQYTVSAGAGTPDHVAILVRAELGYPVQVLPTTATSTVSNPVVCGGDSTIGVRSGVICHERIVHINNQTAKSSTFGVVVNGNRGPLTTSVVVKKGASNQGACAIVGLGIDPALEAAPVTEVISEPGSDCAAEFTLDRITGKVLHVQVVSANPDCKLNQTPVENLNLSVDGSVIPFGLCNSATCPLGAAKFGEGYVHSGGTSCTTRIIGGTVYSWGAPCP